MRIKSLLDLPPEVRARVQGCIAAEAKPQAPAPKVNKFRNEVVESEGERYGSKWELRRFQELQQQAAAGLITDLKHHTIFALHVRTPAGDTVRVASYEADFTYRRDGKLVVEDTKSEPTRKKESYQLKAKHFEAEYGLRLIEVLRVRRKRGTT